MGSENKTADSAARIVVAGILARFSVDDAHIQSIGISEGEVASLLTGFECRGYRRAIEDAAKVVECCHELWDVAATIRALMKEG